MKTTLPWDESHNLTILLLRITLYPGFDHYEWSCYGHLPKLNVCYLGIFFVDYLLPVFWLCFYSFSSD